MMIHAQNSCKPSIDIYRFSVMICSSPDTSRMKKKLINKLVKNLHLLYYFNLTLLLKQ